MFVVYYASGVAEHLGAVVYAYFPCVVNLRRACAARVTVLGLGTSVTMFS